MSWVDWDCGVREGRGRGQESGEIFVELCVRARDSEIGRRGAERSRAYFNFR